VDVPICALTILNMAVSPLKHTFYVTIFPPVVAGFVSADLFPLVPLENYKYKYNLSHKQPCIYFVLYLLVTKTDVNISPVIRKLVL
jgi:hypothetical protein